jgi:hypothetical protein
MKSGYLFTLKNYRAALMAALFFGCIAVKLHGSVNLLNRTSESGPELPRSKNRNNPTTGTNQSFDSYGM